MSGKTSYSADEGSPVSHLDSDENIKLKKDIEELQKKICEFEIYLMEMEAEVGGLQKERDKIDQENVELQKENEKFHQEIKFEKIHNADLKNELKKARRNYLAAKNKGLSIFGWENKWEKMERKKRRLEEENREIESEVQRLKKYIEEQRKDLISQKHTNFELLNQLTECVDVNNRKIMVLEVIWKKVEGYTSILEDHFIELKTKDWNLSKRVPRDSVDHTGESQDNILRKVSEE